MDSRSALMLPDVAGAAIRRLAVVPSVYQNGSAVTTSVTETVFAVISSARKVSSVHFVPNAAVTPAAGSNTQTITITKYDGAGGSGTIVAVGTIANATPAVQYQKLALTLAVTSLEAGSVLTFKTTAAGTATLPVGTLTVDAEIV